MLAGCGWKSLRRSKLSEKCRVNFAFHVSWIFFFHLDFVHNCGIVLQKYVCSVCYVYYVHRLCSCIIFVSFFLFVIATVCFCSAVLQLVLLLVLLAYSLVGLATCITWLPSCEWELAYLTHLIVLQRALSFYPPFRNVSGDSNTESNIPIDSI